MAATHLMITRMLEDGALVDLIIEGEGFEPPQITLDLTDPDDTVRAVLAQVRAMGWQIRAETVTSDTPTQHTTRYTLTKH